MKTHTSARKKLAATLVALFAILLIACIAVSILKDRAVPLTLFEVTADTSETEIREYTDLLENNQALLAANGIASNVLRTGNRIVLNLKSQDDFDTANVILAFPDKYMP